MTYKSNSTNFSEACSALFSKSIILVILFIAIMLMGIGCGGHHVLLNPPELYDEVPVINTGFYTVHNVSDGIVSDTIGNEFLGKMVYLYKDNFFVDKEYYTGIKGSFLQNNYVKSRKTSAGPTYYWQNAEDEDISGEIVFDKIESAILTASVSEHENKKHTVEFHYHSPHIWTDSVGTISIAHRGISYQPPTNYDGIFPANTIPGFEAALRSGYGGFELDVRITKDNRFIISHDENLNVATTIKGVVADKNLSDFHDVLVVKSAAIPEKKSTAKQAFIAALMPDLKTIIDRFLPDPRLKTIAVDIKPDTDEKIINAVKYDFEDLSEKSQRKILFLTRSPSAAKGIKKICPYSDIAIEGSIGPEPIEELDKYYPEAVGKPRHAHNTISFGANIILAFNSVETSLEKINRALQLSEDYNYKICMWTFAREWRFDFLRENKIFPDYLLSDVPYYKYALQELRYNDERDIHVYQTMPVKEEFKNPIYKRMYKQHVRDFWFRSRNMLEISYGPGTPNEYNFESDFAGVGLWELKYGRSEINKYSKTNVELNERYLFISYINSAAHFKDPEPGEVTTRSSRFGIGTNDGIGYYGYDVSFIPYISQAFTWTRLNDYSDFIKPEAGKEPSNEYEILNRYQGKYRFGDRAVYGIKAEIRSTVQLSFAYETAVIYPRHLFWYWSGSFILSRVGYGLLAHYTDKLVTDEHVIGPVINFAVKAVYLYGYYLLREKDMNWPFNTGSPLRYEIFTLGVSLVL